MRGNHCCSMLARPSDAQRTIPACAGEPLSRNRICALVKDYPRVCGGTIHGDIDRDRWQGLSPRVRGNHQVWM